MSRSTGANLGRQTHNSGFAESAKVCSMYPAYPASAEAGDREMQNSDKVCNFCHKRLLKS